MPNPTQTSLSADLLTQLADRKETELIKKHPDLAPLFNPTVPIHSTATLSSSPTVLQAALNQVKSSRQLDQLASAELNEVFDKLISAMKNHELWEDAQLRLYLEQQLSDLLGHTVSSEFNSAVLPIWHGRVLGESQLNRKMYAVHYPSWLWSKYTSDPLNLDAELKAKKWALISPFQQRIVVGEYAGTLVPTHRYGIAVSPELLRLGRFWWPGESGDAVCFLIDSTCPSGLLYAQ